MIGCCNISKDDCCHLRQLHNHLLTFYLFYRLTMIVSINLHFVKFLLNEHGMVWYGIIHANWRLCYTSIAMLP